MFISFNDSAARYDVRSVNYSHIENGELGNDFNCYLDNTAASLADTIEDIKSYVGITIKAVHVFDKNGELLYDVVDNFKIDTLFDTMNEEIDRREVNLRLKKIVE